MFKIIFKNCIFIQSTHKLALRNDLLRSAYFSISSFDQQKDGSKISSSLYSNVFNDDIKELNNLKANSLVTWKKDIVIVPIQTTVEDLKRTHKLVGNGFYLSHRSYIEKIPEKYTIEPIKVKKTGGYDIQTKERLFRRVGGGLPVYWYFVDFKRVGPKSGPPLVEKVIDIFKTNDRTGFIALVAHADIKRYILATQNMKIGDIIRTSQEIPKTPVKPFEGDAFPLGALPIGTTICNIEPVPGNGGVFCRAAGSSALITNQIDDRIIVKLPSGLDLSLDKNCMATVGQISHATYKDEKLSHPVDTRDLGYRPRSGLWQRKDGYAGRKINSPKPIKVITGPSKKPESNRIKYTYLNWSLTE